MAERETGSIDRTTATEVFQEAYKGVIEELQEAENKQATFGSTGGGENNRTLNREVEFGLKTKKLVEKLAESLQINLDS